MKIGLFYGSTTCYTEMVAEKIQAFIGEDIVELHNIKDVSLSTCQAFDFIIMGISTWDYGELQEDWESSWSEVSQLELTNKVVACYGMGDQIGYTEWFQDALGLLHEQLLLTKADIIGFWPNTGYEFSASKALTEDLSHFVGLSIDDENQYQQTDDRIASWCTQILEEFAEIIT